MTDWQNRIVGYTTKPANQLAAHPYNARRHPAKQREALRGSLDSLGIISPVLENIRTGFIIDGHARVEEMLTRDENMEVPVIQLDLDESEEALALASFDFITYMAQYDRDNLDALLQSVNTDNAAMQSLLSELAEDNGLYFGDEPQDIEAPEAQIDRAEELLQKWGVVAGDIWEIPSQHGGVHRLMCGDSTSAEDVALLMGNLKADMVFTDPPYGMDLDTDFSGMKSKLFKGKTGGNYHQKIVGDSEQFDPSFIFNFWGYVPELFLWGADYYAESLPCKNEGSWIVWDKRLDESADKMWGSTFELCWSKAPHKRDIARIKWAGIFGMENQDTKHRVHPTQKPIELVEWFLSRYQGRNVVDPYLGSGTTLIACERLQRICIGAEIEPKYCAVILERMSDMGLEPRKVS